MPITEYGYVTTPKADVKSKVQKIFTDALGEDLDLSDETPQGNLINALTDMLHQIDMNRQADFYARDLYKAVGTQLDIIGRELDIPRKASVPTQVLVSIQGAVNYKIAAGTLANVTTDSSQVFEFTDTVEMSSETVQATLTATNGSTYESLMSGQQLQTQEYTPQIYSITIVSVIHGQPEETDYLYRTRLIDAKSAATDEVEHFTLALKNINNVLSAYIEVNNTLATSDTGVPSHAVEIVVLGGSEADIGDVILDNIFATPTYQNPTLGEEITVLDYNGHEQVFYITRPEMRTVSVSIVYENKAGHTLSNEEKELIKNDIVEFINTIYMNKTLYVSDVYGIAIEGYTDVYAVNSITIRISGTESDESDEIINSYTCSTREYLYAETVTFTEAE